MTSAAFVPKQQIAQIAEEENKPVPSASHAPTNTVARETERAFRAQAQLEKNEHGADSSEEEFGDLADEIDHAAPANYDWSDKYRPRKPRYFNRVHTGFEWSRYNQTHYESVFLIPSWHVR